MWPQTETGKIKPCQAVCSVCSRGFLALALFLSSVLLCLGVFPKSAQAALDVEFYAVADRESMTTDETVRLTVTLSFDSSQGAETLILPEFAPDFRVLSKSQSEQRSFHIDATGMPSSRNVRTFKFTLAPTKAGRLTIPPGKLRISGKNYETARIAIDVKQGTGGGSSGRTSGVKSAVQNQNDGDSDDDDNQPASGRSRGNSGNNRRRSQAQSPFAAMGIPDPMGALSDLEGLMDQEELDALEQLFGMSGQVGRDRRRNDLQDNDLFVRAVLDKKTAYIGEQITMSIILYARTDVSGISGMKMPKLDGFWAEDIETPSQITAERRVINGVTYQAFLLRKKALFPLKAGKQTIDSVDVDIDISMGFFFSGGRKAKRKSAPVAIQVLPLPQKPPNGFEPANVGNWKFTAEAAPSTVPLGQPVTLKLTLEGRGNLRNITQPPLPEIDGFKAYEPTTTERITTSKNRFGGRRTFEYILMPTRVGTFTVPSLTFSFFDPAQKKYRTIDTKPMSLKVTAGTGGQLPLASLQSGAALQASMPNAFNVLDADGLKPLRYKGDIRRPRQTQALFTHPWFVPIAVSPLVLWLLLTVAGVAKSALTASGGIGRGKEKGAGRRLKKRLKQARSFAASRDADKFYAEVADALSTYVSERSGKSASGMTRPELKSLLVQAGMKDDACDGLIRVLDACDAGRFAPGAAEESTMKQILEEAGSAVRAMESLRLESAPDAEQNSGEAA